MWQGEPVARSTVHARRRLAAMALLTLLGAALVVALDRRGGEERPQSALGPGVVGGVATAKPFTYVPAQRAAYERGAALGLSHVLYAKSPGGVVASARRTAHWRPIVDRVAKRHGLDAGMLEAIVMLESAGRADARASDDLQLGRGADPDPGRDRPATCWACRSTSRPPSASRAASCAAAACASARRCAGASTSASTRPRRSRPPRATSTSPRASSGATTWPSSPTTWASATCSRR